MQMCSGFEGGQTRLFSVRGKEGKTEHLKSSDFSLNQNNDLNFSVVLLGSRESGGPKEYMLF